MQVFSEKVSPGSVGSATGSATGSVGSVEGTKIAIYGAGSVGSVATMGMVARLRNIGLFLVSDKYGYILSLWSTIFTCFHNIVSLTYL